MKDRLIELIEQSGIICDNCPEYDCSGWAEHCADHLLANGVIVPPFTIGQTTYIVDYFSNEIIEGTYQGVDCSKFENFFTTREEAERALKERREQR